MLSFETWVTPLWIWEKRIKGKRASISVQYGYIVHFLFVNLEPALNY